MSLDAAVVLKLGPLALDVTIEAEPRETVVLLGPNGAGKTTMLRAIAGLLPVDSGRVVLDGDVLDDPRTRAWTSPERRSVGYVFQDHALFPHMTALENVAFGLRARGVRRREARGRAEAWLERVGVAAHAAARPRALSGGQAQRVALARALAPEPRVLLLDEPLAALDATARVDTRRELRRHLDSHDGVRVVVTHDPVDAMTLGDRVVVIEDGRVVQSGPLPELRERPRSRYVADLVGVNLYRGSADGRGTISLPDRGELVAAAEDAGDVFAVVPPRAVALHRREPEGTPRNVLAGTVEHLDVEGDRVRVIVAGPVPVTAEVTPAAVDELELAPGTPVWASIKATEITVFPA
ncbi:MAG TPA: ABC transporter ATP-binding protein [Acidimicrobiia bacterium]|nr:ABC transporter ATP-binding protein [Acidimicrobiia bacterium]